MNNAIEELREMNLHDLYTELQTSFYSTHGYFYTMQNFKPSRFPLILYKRILRLHYGLPTEMRLMGDTYVKDEFKRHKNCNQEQSLIFLKEWTNYCMMLSKQLSNKGIVKGELGKPLEAKLLEKLEDEQLMQLFELKCEAEKWGQGNFEEEEIKVKEGS